MRQEQLRSQVNDSHYLKCRDFAVNHSDENHRLLWDVLFLQVKHNIEILNLDQKAIDELSELVDRLRNIQQFGSNELNAEYRTCKVLYDRINLRNNPPDKKINPKITEDLQEEYLKKLKDAASEAESVLGSLSGRAKDFEERYGPGIQNRELLLQQSAFRDQAIDELSRASQFMVWAVLAGVFLAFSIFLMFNYAGIDYNLPNKATNYNALCKDCGRSILIYEIVRNILFRILVVSVGGYIVAICIKNYNASMHNYEINLHRANALDAAHRIIIRSGSPETQQEILKLAAQAIFSYQKTGHLDKETEPTNITPTWEKLSNVVKDL